MNYQLYQIGLFFAIYSILGFILSVLYRALVNEFSIALRTCKMPCCPSYGLGALGIIFAMSYLENNPLVAFATGAVIGSLVEIVTVLLARLCSGKPIGKFKWYYPLLFGAGGTILMTHLHQLIELATNRISPWIHFGFLVIFFIVFIADYVDGVAALLEQRKESTNQKTTE